MACHGVPVITAGTGRYSGLGFTVDSTSAEEYLQRLAHIQELPPMSQGKTELARRFAYALFKRRLWPMRSFETVKMRLEQIGHPVDQNLIPRVENFEQFAAAPDLRGFVEWLASEDVDYFEWDGGPCTKGEWPDVRQDV